MNRRKFIKSGALFVPATFGIFVPRVRAQVYLENRRNAFRTVPGGGGCATARDTDTGTTNGNQTWASSSPNLYVATRFVAAATTTICRIDMAIYKLGTPTMNLFAFIYTHDAGNDSPNVLVGSESSALSATTLGTTDPGTFPSFTGLSASITASTVYWVCMRAASVGDASNNIIWSYGGSADSRFCTDSDGAGVWGGAGTRHLKFNLFSA